MSKIKLLLFLAYPSSQRPMILEKSLRKIKAFDPQAIKESKGKLKHFKGTIFCKDEYEAIEGADALVIITEWNQFRR